MKKRLIFTFLLFVLVSALLSVSVCAQDFPSKPNQAQESASTRQSSPNEPFYGYVPPPPIRHTWPGGYKVIFHELLNTLSEHILGQY